MEKQVIRFTFASFLFTVLFFFAVPAVHSEAIGKDLKGSHDHPLFPRIKDSIIIGFKDSDYDTTEFVTAWEKNSKPSYHEAEGKRTRLAYVAPAGVSTIQILRSYQQAFVEIGEVDERYQCRKADYCKRLRPKKEARVDISTVPSYMRSVFYGRNDKSPFYWYGTITNGDSKFHVSLFSALQNSGEPNLKRFHNRAFIWLEIVEVSDFSPTLEFVTSDEMTKAIGEKGHVALYGILFEFDSDKLKTESDKTLEELVKALSSDPSLSVYVVGHTDNQGSLAYNQGLSERRASAVVEKLVVDYKLNRDRLLPVGVGPVAPVASNATEVGRALNRRVELVPR
jgi:outer membrane protein OmpA-like peptidoglycan-associated protein